jgi:hypothetical protein
MTTMLDKVSAAIEAKVRPAMPIYDWDSKDIARAALQAIRVPDLKPSDAWDGFDLALFTAMIDAILDEKLE